MPHLVPQEKGTKVPLTTSKLTLTIDELLKEKLVRFSQLKKVPITIIGRQAIMKMIEHLEKLEAMGKLEIKIWAEDDDKKNLS